MSECEMYAPDYLRAQKDKQLHLIADMIEKQVETIHNLRKQLDLIDRKSAITSLLNGHWEAMRPLLDEWSKITNE